MEFFSIATNGIRIWDLAGEKSATFHVGLCPDSVIKSQELFISYSVVIRKLFGLSLLFKYKGFLQNPMSFTFSSYIVMTSCYLWVVE